MFSQDNLEILDEDTCRRILAGEHVGRVALSLGALPAIFPVNFVFSDDEILFRTAEGAKLAAAAAGAVVAFEVDQWDGLDHTGWSVMVVGRAELIRRESEENHPGQRRLVPWTSGRPSALVRVTPAIWSGRRIRQPDAEPPPSVVG